MSIEIVNLRQIKPTRPYDVKIDRSSPLGNPFHMTTESLRDYVCNKYDKWLKIQMKASKPRIVSELNYLVTMYTEHGKLRLFCWCAPKRCHGESVKNAIIQIHKAYTTLE